MYWFAKKKDHKKYFCISFQRTGTTSVGQFFKDFGYITVGWTESVRCNFSEAWYEGNYEYIFRHKVFRKGQVFEDSPWFHPDFYKILFHRFPNSKFILMTRNSDTWFRSMLGHIEIPRLASNERHCKVYRREAELYDLIDSGLFRKGQRLSLLDNPEHYKKIYEIHAREVREFFGRHSPSSLFYCQLENSLKWQKLGDFLGFKVPENYVMHANRSNLHV